MNVHPRNKFHCFSFPVHWDKGNVSSSPLESVNNLLHVSHNVHNQMIDSFSTTGLNILFLFDAPTLWYEIVKFSFFKECIQNSMASDLKMCIPVF